MSGKLLAMKAKTASSTICERLEVHDEKATAMLLSLSSAKYLVPFLGRENTVAQAAKQLDLDLKNVFRWTQRLVACGLLVQTKTSTRAGRAVRHYQAVASEFVIPVSALPLAILVDTDNGLHQRLQDALMRAWLRNSRQLPWGARVFLDGERMAIDLSDGISLRERITDANAATTRWFPLQLTAQDAQTLSEELFDLEERYKAREVVGEKTYLVHLALAPLED
jgi:hypothetical protein